MNNEQHWLHTGKTTITLQYWTGIIWTNYYYHVQSKSFYNDLYKVQLKQIPQQKQLENVQWIIIPLHIGDLNLWWRHLARDVWKNYRPIE